MADVLKTHTRWDATKKFALAAALSFVLNPAAIVNSFGFLILPPFNRTIVPFFVLILYILINDLVLVIYFARLRQYLAAVGIVVGLVCALAVGWWILVAALSRLCLFCSA